MEDERAHPYPSDPTMKQSEATGMRQIHRQRTIGTVQSKKDERKVAQSIPEPMNALGE